MHRQKGFSFIEIIVVIAILTIVTVLSIPVYSKLKPSIRVNGAARQIMGDLMLARMQAVSENNDYIITFGTSTNEYNIFDDNNDNFISPNVDVKELVKTGNISDEYKDIGYGFIPGMKNISGGTLTAGNDVVTFTPSAGLIWFKFKPNGRSNKNGSIYLIPDKDKATGREDRSRVITVIQTGRVTIKRYNTAISEWE